MNKFFEAIEGASLIAVCVVLRPLMRPWYSGSGATGEETRMKLPGDDIVPEHNGGYTQAISIQAPPENVWPWIAQVGQGKGGFYSYEVLENVVGCKIHNAGRILPEYQDVKVGDGVKLHPAMAIPVTVVEPGRALACGGRQDENIANNWVFYLKPEKGASRLITRWFFQYKPVFGNRVMYSWLVEPISAVMQRKMLKTIKKLAEGLPGQNPLT